MNGQRKHISTKTNDNAGHMRFKIGWERHKSRRIVIANYEIEWFESFQGEGRFVTGFQIP